MGVSLAGHFHVIYCPRTCRSRRTAQHNISLASQQAHKEETRWCPPAPYWSCNGVAPESGSSLPLPGGWCRQPMRFASQSSTNVARSIGSARGGRSAGAIGSQTSEGQKLSRTGLTFLEFRFFLLALAQPIELRHDLREHRSLLVEVALHCVQGLRYKSSRVSEL
eukprot:SAG11_NODE_8002_length_1071_cov_1.491770_1_plen_164_part_01